MEIIIVLAAVALLVVFSVVQYNRLIRLNITAEEAWSQIEVQLQRRADQGVLLDEICRELSDVFEDLGQGA